MINNGKLIYKKTLLDYYHGRVVFQLTVNSGIHNNNNVKKYHKFTTVLTVLNAST